MRDGCRAAGADERQWRQEGETCDNPNALAGRLGCADRGRIDQLLPRAPMCRGATELLRGVARCGGGACPKRARRHGQHLALSRARNAAPLAGGGTQMIASDGNLHRTTGWKDGSLTAHAQQWGRTREHALRAVRKWRCGGRLGAPCASCLACLHLSLAARCTSPLRSACRPRCCWLPSARRWMRRL